MKHIEVAAAIIRRDNKFFVTQRGYGDFKGYWEFPGGKIEPHEGAEEALVREIREELDVEVSVGERLCVREFDYPDFHLTMHCYFCALPDGVDPRLVEHLSGLWLEGGRLSELRWLPADEAIIAMLG